MVFLVLRVQVVFLGMAVSYHHLFPAFVIVEPTGTRHDDGKKYKGLTLHILHGKRKRDKFCHILRIGIQLDNIASIPRSTPRTYYLIQVM